MIKYRIEYIDKSGRPSYAVIEHDVYEYCLYLEGTGCTEIRVFQSELHSTFELSPPPKPGISRIWPTKRTYTEK